MKKYPSHRDDTMSLKRIEGQIRGVQKMIDDKRYCVDILTQLSAVGSAIARVQDHILNRHLNSCVTKAMQGKSVKDKEEKISEVLQLLKSFRKVH